MRSCVLLAALAASALAQDVNTTYLTGLLGALNGLGLTSLVSVAGSVANNTNGGTALLAQLSQGSKTVFAPSNEAFGRVPQNVSSNTALLTSILSYHIVEGRYNASDFAREPNHTIVRTYLTNSSLVNLEGGKGQVLVIERDDGNDNDVNILFADDDVDVERTATYENLIIHVVDDVLTPPGTISEVARELELSGLPSALQTTNLLAPLEAAQGITIFAPTNQAFNAALAALGSQAQNASVISAVLANHVINGTTVYSTGITAQSFASAGGQPFSFSTNSSGTYVTSGSSSARITRADIPVRNGVIHLIDNVLANTASNPEAAASAVASQSSVAATATSIPGATTAAGGSSPSNNASIRTAGTLPGAAALFSVLAAGMGALLGGMLVL
ncbi:unnamed protein product [Rhizoctonia solani]|uniref:FAS1 domain-containing protein n=1 Tax=Rhizoctonia solani TaxID=456999 RepID=A0A8H2XEQ3_9AGAM|nr:unnamed protein product [Rhizoctonia solani]